MGCCGGLRCSVVSSRPSARRARSDTAWTSMLISSAEPMSAIHLREITSQITVVAAPARVQCIVSWIQIRFGLARPTPAGACGPGACAASGRGSAGRGPRAPAARWTRRPRTGPATTPCGRACDGTGRCRPTRRTRPRSRLARPGRDRGPGLRLAPRRRGPHLARGEHAAARCGAGTALAPRTPPGCSARLPRRARPSP